MAHRSRLSGFIIDCNVDDLDAAADFWAQALGSRVADRDAGDETADYQMLGDTPGDLHIEVQKVTHPSRVHLDIETDDVDAEAGRLEKLGAKTGTDPDPSCRSGVSRDRLAHRTGRGLRRSYKDGKSLRRSQNAPPSTARNTP